jgi:1-aminocyclopropane-1-carboxylate deaminase/D-cysteine desulfhydrase-like pyridoxal-dependent ACC family enzyme
MTTDPLAPAELRRIIARIPRIELAHLPTPLDEAKRFAESLEKHVRIVIKRDDCTGLLLGGNKARHNEFLLGDAVASKCDVVVWGAGVQSNNCRQTAAGCAKLGLECQLILSRQGYSTSIQGNLLLDHLVGASVEFSDAIIGPELDAVLAARAAELRKAGRTPYVWHRPRVVPLAAISYVLCVVEIVEQLAERNVKPDAIYVSSSGATGAGVALGAKLLGLTCPIRLICPMPWPWSIPEALARDANAATEMLGLPHRLAASEIDADESYIAPGYGKPSLAGHQALQQLARTEAILLDPVYSAKAMAALIADVKSNRFAEGSTIVFIHTGGVPAIFADPESVLNEPK